MNLGIELLQTEQENGKLITFCNKCNKKIKGKNEQGLRTAIGMHYRKKHTLSVSITEQKILCIISAPTLTTH